MLARLDRRLAWRPTAGGHGGQAEQNGGHAQPVSTDHHGHDEAAQAREVAIGRFYLRTAGRRIRRSFAELWDNDDDATTSAAAVVLRGEG